MNKFSIKRGIFSSVKRYLCKGLTCLVAIDISSTWLVGWKLFSSQGDGTLIYCFLSISYKLEPLRLTVSVSFGLQRLSSGVFLGSPLQVYAFKLLTEAHFEFSFIYYRGLKFYFRGEKAGGSLLYFSRDSLGLNINTGNWWKNSCKFDNIIKWTDSVPKCCTQKPSFLSFTLF